MRHFVEDNDVVDCFDYNVWKQERNLIYFKHLTTEDTANFVRMWTDLHGGYYAPIAEYTLDANYEAVIDMSDYIRAYPNVHHIYVECNQDNAIDIPLAVVGLINPASVIVPKTDKAVQLEDAVEMKLGNIILPPRKMLRDIGYTGTNICCEFWPAMKSTPWGGDYMWGERVIADEVHRSTQLILGQRVLKTYANDKHVSTWALDDLECEKRYAAVRWVSFTGATRLHTFEVRDCAHEVGDIIDLETMDGSWRQIKGRTDSFKLYIDGLEAYDMWYYSDIVTSSSVEVSFDGESWQRVEVVAKSATTPNTDEGAFGKLEIAINWKRYDAVNM